MTLSLVLPSHPSTPSATPPAAVSAAGTGRKFASASSTRNNACRARATPCPPPAAISAAAPPANVASGAETASSSKPNSSSATPQPILRLSRSKSTRTEAMDASGEKKQHRAVARHDCRHIPLTEGQRRSSNAEAGIVVAVHHGVLGIVSEGVADVCRKQQPAHRRKAILYRRIRHRDAEAECNPEIGLRQRQKAFGERVAHRDREADKRQQDGKPVERKHQAECGEREDGAEGERLGRTDLAGGERSRSGAFDVRIEIAVRIIVDRAAGGAHHDRA